ncbi:MAG: DUF47 family protein [Clostridia bacterium]|nr:DUF47 family protein [Clostridia bacterium]
MAKADKVFFENLIEAANSSCKAAQYLVECLENYNPENITDMLEKMHEYEQEGDMKRHEMSAVLAKAFVTPVDREDLALISHNVDEVTDDIEEILQRFYANRITTVLPEALEFAKNLLSSCVTMKEMLGEFQNFKKPAKLYETIVKMNDFEELCDKLYLDAKFKVRDNCKDVLDVISWREIYDKMERCADDCEHVADTVANVVMKNS